MLKNAQLWVDGFAGFTTAEIQVLAEMLKAAKNSHIALCLDPSDIDLKNPDLAQIDPVSLFNTTERTYAQLVEIIKKCKLSIDKPILLNDPLRFSSAPQLAHIEKNIFKITPPKATRPDDIHIISAPNTRCEVTSLARQILKLVKEKNYRYRDIAVIASDIDTYQYYIRACFQDYNIPFFIDKRKPLNQHPVIQLICSALQIVLAGFSPNDIFAYLKTDLVPVDRSDTDLLENYCIAFGLKGWDWQSNKNWNFADPQKHSFDQAHINQIRSAVTGPLLQLQKALCPEQNAEKTITAQQFTDAVFEFLDQLNVSNTIDAWIKQARQQNNHAAAQQHEQFYDKFVEVFDQLLDVFAQDTMTSRDYCTIINSAFSQLTLAFIPPTLDQVLVGSIERSRHPGLKAVFLIGATQKQFPSPLSQTGLLTDTDRDAAQTADFQLAPATSLALAQRQYLAYIAFTRPSQFLYISYPAADGDGKSIIRSQFISNLESLFTDLKERTIADQLPNIDEIHCQSELADLLCTQLGKDKNSSPSDDSLDTLLNEICADDSLSDLGSTVTSAINYTNSPHLEKDVVNELFGPKVNTSATRLTTFAKCPYLYFSRYILKLKKRQQSKFEPLDLGNFYHKALDSLLKELKKQNKDFNTIADQQLLGILDSVIEKLCSSDSAIENFTRQSLHNAFIINSAADRLCDCVLAIAQMTRAGTFTPYLSEAGFGTSKDQLGEYKFPLSKNRTVYLRGKIDRIDFAEIDGQKLAIVFDYKRTAKSFSWSKFYNGLDLQLPIYILATRNAAESNPNIPPAQGAFLIPVEVSPKKIQPNELAAREGKFFHKANGLFHGAIAENLDTKLTSKYSNFYNFYISKDKAQYGSYHNSGALTPEDFENTMKFAHEKIIALAENILSGKIDITPYKLGTESPCSNCDYNSLCRFDWQINDYNLLQSPGKAQVLETIGGLDG